MAWKDKSKVAEYISERRRKYKRKLVDLKGGKCQVCGYNRCIAVLEFHHEDEKDKKNFLHL